MKILLISGHGAGDPGARGNGYEEATLTREVTRNLKSALTSKYKVSVDIYGTNRDAYQDVINGKFVLGNYDYVLEVHFNSAVSKAAYGTEIYVTDREDTIGTEQAIMKAMSKYFTLRDGDGVKVTNFAVINTCKNYGVSAALLEVCFISNSGDISVYQTHKKDIAADIANAIGKSFGLEKKSKPKPKIPSYYNSSKLRGVKIKQDCWLCEDYKLKKRVRKLKAGETIYRVKVFKPKGWVKVRRLVTDEGLYLTANTDFVSSTHWLLSEYNGKKRVHVIKDCDICEDKELKKVTGKATKGQVFTVTDVVTDKKGYARLKLKSGLYITAHKSHTEWI